MLIPSIDLMEGRIVQLIQGSKKALEFTEIESWIERFSRYPLVQLIDLDAAMGKGNNAPLVQQLATRLPCQVGGGIRSLQGARTMLEAGAHRVILGSALVHDGEINRALAGQLAAELASDRLVFAVDSRSGKVAVGGWQEATAFTAEQMMQALEPCCSAFLYTHIDSEGLMQGFPLQTAVALRRATARQLIVAGGIKSNSEIEQLDALGVDAVVGMAIYTGQVKT